jgi:DNA-binding NtrC family response regulator
LARELGLAVCHDVPLLVTGETGTGKSRLARLIHESSPRRGSLLLTIPCGALPPDLAGSELFGHTQGAFTGAEATRVGKLDVVGDGTLVLDDIDALGLERQALLLRVVETGEYEPLGSNQTRRCAARFIATSNKNLEEEVAHGWFRPDLYYRLSVLALRLPLLREHRDDIVPLARILVARAAVQFAIHPPSLSLEAQAVLEGYAWPGNVRQLEHVLRQAVLLSRGQDIQSRHLHLPIHGRGGGSRSVPCHTKIEPRAISSIGRPLAC